MRHIIQKVVELMIQFFSASFSLLTILFFSSKRTARKVKRVKRYHEDCIVVGNGPSLAGDVERVLSLSQKCDVICVNTIYRMDFFWQIKPSFYMFIDPALFELTDRTKKLREETINAFNKIDWGMTLIIPHFYRNSSVLKNIKNNNVSVLPINTVRVNYGSERFRHFFYDKQLGMPKAQTVLNGAIYLAIFWRYHNIYLFGADHSWLKDVYVDDENYVLFVQRHAFDKGNNVQVTRSSNNTLARLLRAWANMFESHMLNQEYAKKRNVNVFNCTKGSYIDAYPRLSIEIE